MLGPYQWEKKSVWKPKLCVKEVEWQFLDWDLDTGSLRLCGDDIVSLWYMDKQKLLYSSPMTTKTKFQLEERVVFR